MQLCSAFKRDLQTWAIPLLVNEFLPLTTSLPAVPYEAYFVAEFSASLYI